MSHRRGGPRGTAQSEDISAPSVCAATAVGPRSFPDPTQTRGDVDVTSTRQRALSNISSSPRKRNGKNPIPSLAPKQRATSPRENDGVVQPETDTPSSLSLPKRKTWDSPTERTHKRAKLGPLTPGSRLTNAAVPNKPEKNPTKDNGINGAGRTANKTALFSHDVPKGDRTKGSQKGNLANKDPTAVAATATPPLPTVPVTHGLAAALAPPFRGRLRRKQAEIDRLKLAISAASAARPTLLLPPHPPPSSSPFFRLPRELRDIVYGHLLVSTDPGHVTVMRAWTQCYSRYRGSMEPAILQVCKQAAVEGAQVLYSRNTFLYLLRDNGEPIKEAMDPAGAVSAERRNSRDRVIYLAKYAALFGKLRLHIEHNRTEASYSTAIATALTGLRSAGVRPNLLSIAVSPLLETRDSLLRAGVWTAADLFSAGLAVVSALRRLGCRRVRFEVTTPNGRRLHMDLDGKILSEIGDGTWVRGDDDEDEENEVGKNEREGGEARYWDPLAGDIVAQGSREERAINMRESFKRLRLRIEQACEITGRSIRMGWWVETKSGQRARIKTVPQGVDASKRRVLETERDQPTRSQPRNHRFFCVSRVDGKLKGYIA